VLLAGRHLRAKHISAPAVRVQSPSLRKNTEMSGGTRAIASYEVGAIAEAKRVPPAPAAQNNHRIVIIGTTSGRGGVKYEAIECANQLEADAVSTWVRRRTSGGTASAYPSEKAAHDAVAIISSSSTLTKGALESLVHDKKDLLKTLSPLPAAMPAPTAHNADIIGLFIPQISVEHPANSGIFIIANNAKITSSPTATQLNITFSTSGSAVKMAKVHAGLARLALTTATPTPTVTSIAHFIVNGPIANLLKQCPASALLPPGAVDRLEARRMLTAAGKAASTIPLTVAEDPKITTMITDLTTQAASKGIDMSNAAAWPSIPEDIGKILAIILPAVGAPAPGTAPPAPAAPPTTPTSTTPIVDEIRHRLKGDYDDFAKVAVAIADPSGPHAALLSMPKVADETIEAALKQFQIKPSHIAVLFPPTDTCDAATVTAWFNRLKRSSAAPDSSNPLSQSEKEKSNPNLATMGFYSAGDDDDSKVGLRSAAQSMAEDTKAMEHMNKLFKLADEEKHADLLKEMESTACIHTKRLIYASTDEIGKALLGTLNPTLISKIERVRKALDMRIIRTLIPSDESPTAELKKAVKAVRTGRLSKCKLASLIDLIDKGTEAAPFTSIQSRASALQDLTRCLGKLSTIVQRAHPTQTAKAAAFFDRLIDQITKFISRGASWAMLSKWYKKILDQVERDVRLFFEHSGGGLRLRLDEEIITNPLAKHNIEINEAIMDARTASQGQQGSGKGKGKGKKGKRGRDSKGDDDDDDDDDDSPPAKKQAGGKVTFVRDLTKPPFSVSKAKDVMAAFRDALQKHGMQTVKGVKVAPCGFQFLHGKCSPKQGSTCQYWHT
jgi:hypothetical protein